MGACRGGTVSIASCHVDTGRHWCRSVCAIMAGHWPTAPWRAQGVPTFHAAAMAHAGLKTLAAPACPITLGQRASTHAATAWAARSMVRVSFSMRLQRVCASRTPSAGTGTVPPASRACVASSGFNVPFSVLRTMGWCAGATGDATRRLGVACAMPIWHPVSGSWWALAASNARPDMPVETASANVRAVHARRARDTGGARRAPLATDAAPVTTRLTGTGRGKAAAIASRGTSVWHASYAAPVARCHAPGMEIVPTA